MGGRIVRASGNISRYPEVGKIKVGIKTDSGFPKSVDYFVCTGKYASYFTKTYGERPQTIQIVFPSDDPAECCEERYEYRDDDGKLLAWGDGKDYQVWNGQRYVMYSTDDYPDLMAGISKKHPNKLAQSTGDGWRVHLKLRFIIPAINGIAGVWVFETNGAKSSIPNIVGTFDMMKAQCGHAAGVLFDMNVQFAKSQKPGSRSKYTVVSIIANETEEAISKIKSVQSRIMPNIISNQ